MNRIDRRTNGDRIQPLVDGARAGVAEFAQWAREHPDEFAVALTPALLLGLATGRHALNFRERLVIAVTASYTSETLLHSYQRWKSRPAGPVLKKVM